MASWTLESELTKLWLKWVESGLSHVSKFGIWAESESSIEKSKVLSWVGVKSPVLPHEPESSQPEKSESIKLPKPLNPKNHTHHTVTKLSNPDRKLVGSLIKESNRIYDRLSHVVDSYDIILDSPLCAERFSWIVVPALHSCAYLNGHVTLKLQMVNPHQTADITLSLLTE